jgi:hypothetical protein
VRRVQRCIRIDPFSCKFIVIALLLLGVAVQLEILIFEIVLLGVGTNRDPFLRVNGYRVFLEDLVVSFGVLD